MIRNVSFWPPDKDYVRYTQLRFWFERLRDTKKRRLQYTEIHVSNNRAESGNYKKEARLTRRQDRMQKRKKK